MIAKEIGQEVNPGVIEKFLEQLPERAFHLGLRVVLAGLAFVMGIQVIRLIRHFLKKALKRSRADESAVNFIDSFVKFSLYFVLILMIASSLGVDAASILAILGSASVAVGLAVQGSLSNLIGGVLLLVMKPFTAGDYIRDGQGNEGTVSLIDIFYTHLVTPDNKTIMLPNGALANEPITNYTSCTERRIDVPVGIAYQEDIQSAKAVIGKVLCGDKAVLQGREALVFVDSLGESSVMLNARCWVGKEDYWTAKWRITEEIKYALDDAGITIPFPQLDVHLEKTNA